MLRPAYRISLAYLFFTILYYGVSSLIFFSKKTSGTNFLESLFLALSNMFFWITVHYYFAIAIFVSAVLGMIISKYKAFPESFKVFRNICIGEVVIILILALIANIS